MSVDQRTEVSTEEIMSLSRSLASLMNLEESAERLIRRFKELAFRLDEDSERVASLCMFEIAAKVNTKLEHMRDMQDCQSHWNVLPTVYVICVAMLGNINTNSARKFGLAFYHFSISGPFETPVSFVGVGVIEPMVLSA